MNLCPSDNITQHIKRYSSESFALTTVLVEQSNADEQ